MQTNHVVRPINSRHGGKSTSTRYFSAVNDSNACAACFHKSNCLAGDLEAEELSRYSRAVTRSKRFTKGDYLFRLSDPVEALYMILSGSVKSCWSDEDGNEQIIGLHIPGDLLALDAINSGIHPSSAIALEDCFVCKIPYRLFDERFSDTQRLKSKLVQQVVQALRTEHLHSVYLRKKTADQRLAMFLSDLSGRLESRHHASDRIDLSLSRRDIGNYLGLALETVSRSFSRLQDQGMIAVNHRHVVIHGREQLATLGRGFAGPDMDTPRIHSSAMARA